MASLRAEWIIDFVEQDASYLLYALISRDWYIMWNQRDRPKISRMPHFLATPELLLYAVCSGLPMTMIGAAYYHAISSGNQHIVCMLYVMQRVDKDRELCRRAFIEGKPTEMLLLHNRGLCPEERCVRDFMMHAHVRRFTWDKYLSPVEMHRDMTAMMDSLPYCCECVSLTWRALIHRLVGIMSTEIG